jgi:hypothetical protein
MRHGSHFFKLTLLVVGLATTTAVGGCYHHYYGGGGSWTVTEEPYYERWEHETHRDHVDYAQRNSDEQHQYWQWRQSHS